MSKKKKYYVVISGRKPGIYTTWTECQQNVNGYGGCKFKSFLSVEQAEEYYSSFYRNLPKDKRYTPDSIKNMHIDNCVLCGKPFKQQLRKKGKRKNSPCCQSCKKEKINVQQLVFKETSGIIKTLTIDELLYLKKNANTQNILEYLTEHPKYPLECYQKIGQIGKISAGHALSVQRKQCLIDSSIKNIPSYVKKTFGECKEVIAISGDKRDPLITYHCKRCNCDYQVHYRDYQKVKGHNCSALISSGEAIIADYLNKCNIPYKSQRDTLQCINPDTGYPMPYDFEIANKKILIEVQGEQHRQFIERFHITLEGFEYQKKKDLYKKTFAEKNGYRLLEIWYEDIDNNTYKELIENALKEEHEPMNDITRRTTPQPIKRNSHNSPSARTMTCCKGAMILALQTCKVSEKNIQGMLGVLDNILTTTSEKDILKAYKNYSKINE